jgi:hypothetical protein
MASEEREDGEPAEALRALAEKYEKRSRAELEQRAGEVGIIGHSGMTKEQLIRELLEH